MPGLAQYSYVLSSEGRAIVIDPMRDFDRYTAYAHEQGLAIKYVTELTFMPISPLVSDKRDDKEARRSVARVGLEHIDGFLQKGMPGWIDAGREFTRTVQLSAEEVAKENPTLTYLTCAATRNGQVDTSQEPYTFRLES